MMNRGSSRKSRRRRGGRPKLRRREPTKIAEDRKELKMNTRARAKQSREAIDEWSLMIKDSYILKPLLKAFNHLEPKAVKMYSDYEFYVHRDPVLGLFLVWLLSC
jgi:hypothetical protein